MCKYEFHNRKYGNFNERPVEMAFVFKNLARFYPKSILDVGTGISPLPRMMSDGGHHVTAIDNIKDYWSSGFFNPHYYIIDDDITDTKITETFDFITCISVLEHIENYKKAVGNMFKLLKPGGHLILTFPYTEKKYVENVYKLPGSKYGQDFQFTCQSYSRAELDSWIHGNGTIIEQEYWQFWTGDTWTIGDQIIPPVKVNLTDNHQISCLLIEKSK